MERVMPTEVPRDIQSQALVWPKLSAAMGYAQDMTISLKAWTVMAEFTFPVVPVLLQVNCLQDSCCSLLRSRDGLTHVP